MTALDDRLLDAHAQNDKPALITLYTEAADSSATDVAAGFYRTHAYVFALELGDPRARALHAQLKQDGRES